MLCARPERAALTLDVLRAAIADGWSAIAPPVAIANAVCDALRGSRVELNATPVNPEKDFQSGVELDAVLPGSYAVQIAEESMKLFETLKRSGEMNRFNG